MYVVGIENKQNVLVGRVRSKSVDNVNHGGLWKYIPICVSECAYGCMILVSTAYRLEWVNIIERPMSSQCRPERLHSNISSNFRVTGSQSERPFSRVLGQTTLVCSSIVSSLNELQQMWILQRTRFSSDMCTHAIAKACQILGVRSTLWLVIQAINCRPVNICNVITKTWLKF